MAIIRVEKIKNYSVMSNYHLKEKKLSLKAKGLMSVMLSLPDDWDYSVDGLVSILNEGYDSVKTALDELKQFGYLEVIRHNPDETDSGRLEYEYIVHEQSIFDTEQGPEKQVLEDQGLEDRPQLNTNKQNTKNKKEKKEKAKTEIDLVLDKTNYNDALKEMIYEFIKMRKTIKKPMTTIAVKRLINKLDKFTNNDKEKIQILDKSIFNSWQDIYPLKPEEKQDIEYEHELTYTADDFTPEQYNRLMRGQMSKEEMIQILKEKKNV